MYVGAISGNESSWHAVILPDVNDAVDFYAIRLIKRQYRRNIVLCYIPCVNAVIFVVKIFALNYSFPIALIVYN